MLNSHDGFVFPEDLKGNKIIFIKINKVENYHILFYNKHKQLEDKNKDSADLIK